MVENTFFFYVLPSHSNDGGSDWAGIGVKIKWQFSFWAVRTTIYQDHFDGSATRRFVDLKEFSTCSPIASARKTILPREKPATKTKQKDETHHTHHCVIIEPYTLNCASLLQPPAPQQKKRIRKIHEG
jgi:hypothetical protein